MRCWICNSPDHLAPSCPRNSKNASKREAHVNESTDDEESFDQSDSEDDFSLGGFFYSVDNNPGAIDVFWNKPLCGNIENSSFIVDAEATGSIASANSVRPHNEWLESMGKSPIVWEKGGVSFRFGNNRKNLSAARADIPILVGGKWRSLSTHIFSRDCPNLLALDGILDLGGVADAVEGVAVVKNTDNAIHLHKSDNGRLLLNVRDNQQPVDQVGRDTLDQGVGVAAGEDPSHVCDERSPSDSHGDPDLSSTSESEKTDEHGCLASLWGSESMGLLGGLRTRCQMMIPL